jgi:hypothetical protein
MPLRGVDIDIDVDRRSLSAFFKKTKREHSFPTQTAPDIRPTNMLAVTTDEENIIEKLKK